MDTQIKIMGCNSSHLEHLVELGRTYYPIGHPILTKEFLNWLYLDNPAGPATLVFAEEGGCWIGLIALIPIILEYKGNLQKACFAVNVLTHPDHRTKTYLSK